MTGSGIDWKLWLDIAWKSATALGLLFLWLRRPARQNSARIEAHEHKIHQHDLKLIKLEGDVRGAPSHSDLQHLHNRISKGNEMMQDTREHVAQLLDAVKGLRAGQDRLTDYLLNKKGDQ